MKLILPLLLIALGSFGQTLIDPSASPTTSRINEAIAGTITATGTDTYSVALTGTFTYSYLNGKALSVTFTNPNTGASTLNFDGLGAKNIYKWSGGSLGAVSAGDLIGTIRVRYDGTQFVMEGGSGSGGGGVSLSANNTWTGNNAFTNNRVTVSGTTYTILSTDWGKSIDFTNAADITVTLPNGLASGFNCSLYKQGTGDVIVTATGTLEANASPATIEVLHAGAYVEHKGSNVWEATGQFGSAAGGGDMLASTYDPATIAEQLVGLTASQALTGKSVNGVTLTAAGSSSNFLNAAGSYTVPTLSGAWSLATGGTLTGVNTITSNVNSGINFAGTWTATATSQAHVNFGGTFTAFGGTPNILYGYRFNPTLVGSGTGGTQVGVQINPSFSGGTTPRNVMLQLGAVTPISGYDFQAYTGYYSGSLRFDAALKDNRDNNFIQQSSSATPSNRTMNIGNSTYSTVDFVHAGTLQSNQSAVNNGVAPNAFKVIGGAHTNLTLNNPVMDVYFNIGRTVQSATGTIANNRYVYIENPTHSFVGASTSSREVTVAIKGAPIAGPNATHTFAAGLEVESAAVGAGTITSYGGYFNAQTGATNNYGIGVTGGINFTGALMPAGSAGTAGQILTSAGAGSNPTWTTPGSGDVVGPSSSVAGTLALFDGTTGKLLKEAVSATNRVTSDGGQILFEKVSSVTGNNLIRASNGVAGENHAMGLLLLGGNASGSNYDGGDVIIQSGIPNGSGAKGAVQIADSADKLGFFEVTPVVKQSAPTTAQGIADVLTAYGLIPTSTISGGGGSGLTYSQVSALSVIGN